MRMTLQDWALLFLLSILWGGSFFFVAIAIRDLPPLTVVVLRTGIAALALGAILRMRGEAWPFARGAVGAFLVMGLLNNMIPFSLLFWAQTTIPSGLASILNATTPIFSIVVAHFLLADERMAPNKATGILFGFLGVVVLLGGNVVTGAGDVPLARARTSGRKTTVTFDAKETEGFESWLLDNLSEIHRDWLKSRGE